jgi:hypothetical protein
MFPEHPQHQPQSGSVGWHLEPLAAVENQFQLNLALAWPRRFSGWRSRFHQRESDRLFSRTAELPPPPVERILTELMLAAKRSHGLAAVLLLCDSLAPQLAPLSLFGAAHFSTLRRNFALRQRGSCDAY